MNAKRAWTAGLLLGVALLAACSIYLTITRIYQVDECQTVYMARVLATGQSAEFFTTSSLVLFGPLSWISASPLSSAGMFTVARLLFIGIFWTNLILVAWIASGKLSSMRGLIALILTATLAPLWDYGFEIRHDNLVLAGVLLSWAIVRVKPLGVASYLIAGGLGMAMLFIAVKSIVYVVPLSLAILVFPPAMHRRPGGQLRLAWVGGALLAAVAIRLGYGSGGAWDDYLSVFRGVSKYSAHANTGGGGGGGGRFLPWECLGRLFIQTPLLLALTVSGTVALAAELFSRGKSFFSWDGLLPEFLLMLGALTALFINPTPFPYNLVHFAPYAFIFAFRHAAQIWNQRPCNHRELWPLTVCTLLVLHLAPFGIATIRHLDKPNTRQQELMRLTETLTDPATDRAYDGIGMVPTRRSVNYHWYLHSISMGWFRAPGTHVRDFLAATPPAVIITSYRTDWLPDEDHEFIEQRYLPLADDFWVLGARLPGGEGTFEIFHPGRYCIVSLNPPAGSIWLHPTNNAPGYEHKVQGAIKLDGMTITNQPVHLEAGRHHIQTGDGSDVGVMWVGPHAGAPPRLGPRNHQLLFENWY